MWSSQNVRHCGHDPHAWRSVLPVSWDNCWEWADGAAGVAPWSDVTRWGDRCVMGSTVLVKTAPLFPVG